MTLPESSGVPANRHQEFLLVEDDEDHAYVVQRILKTSSRNTNLRWISTAMAAYEYLDSVAKERHSDLPALIILDLKLPGLDGHELLKMIKGHAILRSLPVVILTSSGNAADIAKAYELNANSYLQKPGSLIEFKKLISDLETYWREWNRQPVFL